MVHKFVEFMPPKIEGDILYISITYCTAIHKCCCGCGNEVVTPLSPTDWEITFDGESISLYPSVGNWSFPCKSHYWIRNNQIVWATKWSQDEIETVRQLEVLEKKKYYSNINAHLDLEIKSKREMSFWFQIKRWFSNLSKNI